MTCIIAYLILLTGIAIYSLITNENNYVSYKNSIKVLQAKYENQVKEPAATPQPTSGSDTIKVTPTPTSGSNPVKVTPTPTPGSEAVEVTPKPTPGSEPAKPATNQDGEAAVEENYSSINFTRILHNGSIGEDVKKLQYLLKKRNIYNGEIDGRFGNITLSAVKKFQEDNKLFVDGVAGTNTFQRLLE